jgi:plasmid maintenance system antidote protein VapI
LNVTQAELAARVSISVKHVNQIMQGNAPITPETAMILERITGTPAGFWKSSRSRLSRESSWDHSKDTESRGPPNHPRRPERDGQHLR